MIRTLREHRLTVVALEDTNTTDRTAFLRFLFPDREYEDLPDSSDGWHLLSAKDSMGDPVLALKDEFIVVDWRHPWQLVIAHLALATVMRLQPEVCFFHGATIAMQSGGVMLSGDKGTGKTTLSLALAERGYGFLSDEFAAIEWRSGQIFPFRRTASIRPGPKSAGVRQYLSDHTGDVEELADGQPDRKSR